MYQFTLLLETGSDIDALEPQMASALKSLYESTGLVFVYDVTEQLSERTFTSRFIEAADGSAEVVLCVDGEIPATYAQISAKEATDVDSIAELLENRFGTPSIDQLRAAVRRQGPNWSGALMRLSLALNRRWTAEDVELFRVALRASLPTIRADAATAIGASPSPLLRVHLIEAVEAETDETAMRMQRAALQLIDESVERA
jgi:hypothetical protein